jgi:hypothetical protein
MDSSATVCNTLPKVKMASDFNNIHLCIQESSEYKIQDIKVR